MTMRPIFLFFCIQYLSRRTVQYIVGGQDVEEPPSKELPDYEIWLAAPINISSKVQPTYLVVERIVGRHDVEELSPNELLHDEIARFGTLLIDLKKVHL
jgi:hypothetical protein